MTKALIFDCFGVLTTDGWLPFKAKYFGQDPKRYAQTTDLNKQNDMGLLGYRDFVEAVAELAGTTPAVVEAAITGNVPNQPLFDYIASLKPAYKMGVLSNASGNWMDRMFTPQQVALFDAVVLSYEIGAIKPDPKTYQVAAERLQMAPEECVFIDDQERYCAGARDAGMQAVWYQDFDQAQAELNALLGAA